MQEPSKINQELLEEIAILKQRIQELEKSEVERKLTQEALQESERHIKLALEGTDQGLWEWDILSRKVIYDENWPRIMNLPSEGRHVDMDQWLASMDTEGRAAFEINMTNYLAGRVSYYEIEHRLLTENKEWKWIWTRGIATERDPSGIPLRMIGTYRDITKQKQAEESWKESEERFRVLAEYLPETVFETDMQGTLTFVNRNAFNCFRYTPQDFAIGINIHNLIHPDDRGRAMENIQRIMRGEDIGLNEYKLLRKDGSVFPSMSHSSVILSDNEPVGLRGFIIDMTEQKRTEKALRESERKYRLLADRMTDIVWISDLNFNTTYLSPSIEFTLGVSPEERIGYRNGHRGKRPE